MTVSIVDNECCTMLHTMMISYYYTIRCNIMHLGRKQPQSHLTEVTICVLQFVQLHLTEETIGDIQSMQLHLMEKTTGDPTTPVK